MIIEKTMSNNWLSNSWLVADRERGHAVIIDTGGPSEPLLERIRDLRLTVTHVLCTHHHIDHVANNEDYRSAFGCPVCGHAAEWELFGDLDRTIDEGDELVSGGLHIRPLHLPGHTAGQLGFLVNDEAVFTGDTLFKGSIGGTRAPGHATFDELRASLMDKLMALPPRTEVYPGHMDPTTIGAEWEHNPFIRTFRGADAPGAERVTAFGHPATLLLEAPDYDGGTKAWVRFDDGDKLDVVPGSRLERP
jgi:hydroxyacylglutathione hydrolase